MTKCDYPLILMPACAKPIDRPTDRPTDRPGLIIPIPSSRGYPNAATPNPTSLLQPLLGSSLTGFGATSQPRSAASPSLTVSNISAANSSRRAAAAAHFPPPLPPLVHRRAHHPRGRAQQPPALPLSSTDLRSVFETDVTTGQRLV